MNTMLTAIYELFDSINKASAAARFARLGMYSEARSLMTK